MSMTSPMFRLDTSASKGRAPASSMVLKKIGAILPPMQMPPVRLLGTLGMSSAMYQSSALVEDIREKPLPTTSYTKETWWPFLYSSSIWASALVMPSRGILYIALACRGMSGRDQASGAGDRSSVLVSPVTLNTVAVITLATSGRFRNHSASAQELSTALAWALPALAFS